MTHTRTRLSKFWLITSALIAVGLMIGLVYRDFRPEITLLLEPTPAHRGALLHLIRSHGIRDLLFLLVTIALMNAIPGLSNSLICIFVGLCYGPWIGMLVNWGGNVLGNCLVAGLLNHVKISRHFTENRFLQALMHHRHPWLGLTVGYMVPIIPSVLVNYACVKTHVPRHQYLVMVIVGMLPTSALYAFGGDAIFQGNFKRLAVIGGLVIALFLLVLLIRDSRKRTVAN